MVSFRTCPSCSGKGIVESSDHKPNKCPYWDGSGVVRDAGETMKSPSVFPGVVRVEDEIKK